MCVDCQAAIAGKPGSHRGMHCKGKSSLACDDASSHKRIFAHYRKIISDFPLKKIL
ncbi:hypothetical protein SAMN04490205_0217 [Pseudomonas trivialis]|uniref:Recombinase zinc beta ribbon domain-containing protein n=1 Tax=Pseudomonas trivialis TaxID=200450 RepID=A0ABY0U0D9_9PSED|nr:hypothetical protein SAMN04490205_0217 [Pseudomonas trivialis]